MSHASRLLIRFGLSMAKESLCCLIVLPSVLPPGGRIKDFSVNGYAGTTASHAITQAALHTMAAPLVNWGAICTSSRDLKSPGRCARSLASDRRDTCVRLTVLNRVLRSRRL